MKNEKGISFNSFIGRFRPIFAPDIPALYGQGLTDYEIVVRLWRAIVECADTINSFIELVEKLDNILSDFDNAVREEVEKVLKEMYNNGELEDMLNEIANNFFEKLPIKSELDFNRQFRIINEFGDSKLSSQNTVGTLHEHYAQGATYFERNGVGYYVVCYIPLKTKATNNTTNNNAIVSIYQASDFSIVGQRRFLLAHANGIAYNPKDDYFYIAWCVLANGQSSTNVSRILFTDIAGYNRNITDFTNIPSSATQYQEDFTINYPDGRAWSSYCCYFDNNANEIYVGDAIKMSLVSFDNSDNYTAQVLSEAVPQAAINNVMDLYNQLNGENQKAWTWQVGDLTKDYIYILTHNNSQILRISRATNEIDYIYSLPENLQNGYYFMGEPEAIKVMENGDIYLFTSHRIFANNFSQMSMFQAFKTNLYHNIMLDERKDEKYGNEERMTIFVDANMPKPNPTGRLNNPFNRISEAVEFANTTKCTNAITIRILATTTDFIQISTNKPIKIMRDTTPDYASRRDYYAHTVGANTVMYPIIGGIWVNGGSNVIFDTIMSVEKLPNPSSRGIEAFVTVDSANVTFNNCYISAVAYDILGLYNCYKISFSNMILTGAYCFTVANLDTLPNNVYDKWTLNGDFIKHTASSINAHGFAARDGGIIG